MALFIDASLTNQLLIRSTDAGTTTIVQGGPGGAITLRGGTPASGPGENVSVLGQAGVGTNQIGGGITITAGAATGTGDAGTINLTGGNIAGAAGVPGNITITGGAGNGSTTGGAVTITGGNGGSTGAGANVTFTAGAGGSTSGAGGTMSVTGAAPTDGNGGNINITARPGVGTNRSGGNVTLFAGDPTGSGVPGYYSFDTEAVVIPSGTSSGEAALTTDGLIRYDTGLGKFRRRVKGAWADMGRENLEASRTYYVRTDGNDNNTGLVNNSGGAWLTLQKAWNFIQSNLDLHGWVVTVQIGDGTYTAGLTAQGNVPGAVQEVSIVFRGNSVTPGNVVISTTSAGCFTATNNACLTVRDLRVQTTTSGNCFTAYWGANIAILNVVFGACAGNHVEANLGGFIALDDDYSIVGGAVFHLGAFHGGAIYTSGVTCTITGTPTFNVFANAAGHGSIEADNVVYTGSATAKKYDVSILGMINTFGGTVNLFPGGTAGTTATGGQYGT